MSNPLLIFWAQMFGRREPPPVPAPSQLESANQSSSTIFLIMRRMRAPLITVIAIFAISVIGMTLAPGMDEAGHPTHLTLFDAFYFVSYTAMTIGYSELGTFTTAQRLWVTVTIYLTVIAWAYSIGSLLTLLQDRGFRRALNRQRFVQKVSRLREPFFLMVGYGHAAELLTADFDELGQQLVVVDDSSDRIDALDLGSYHADIPGLAADAAAPENLVAAGLTHRCCAGVLALTSCDETNLEVTMAAALLRPDVPVIARAGSAQTADRMRAFGTPSVVNPFDRFGEHLRMALHAPATYQLLTWVEAGPGAELPERGWPPTSGRWVICGYGRFGREVTADLRAAGLDVTVIEPGGKPQPDVIVGDAAEPEVLARANLADAAGLVAGTDNDATNLSMLAAAKRQNSRLFLAARQNRATSAALFEAMHVNALLVPSEVVAHEVYAQLSTPTLWRFIQEMPSRDDEWAANLIQQLRENCGRRLPALWKIDLDRQQAPALQHWLHQERVTLGDLLRSSEDRDRQLQIVPLLLLRNDEAVLTPDRDTVLRQEDHLLLAGPAVERRGLETTLMVDATATYVLTGQQVPSSWVWRKLSGVRPAPAREDREEIGAPRG